MQQSIYGISQLIEELNKLTFAISGQVSVSSLPIAPVQKAQTSTISVSATITTSSVKIIAANADRVGLILYNNSANSVYIALGSAANSNTNMSFIVPTFTSLVLPQPIYTGDIYGIRNAGTGAVILTELK